MYPQPKKRKALTAAEQERFIEVLGREENQQWLPTFMTMLRTGLRVGELTGLVWDDIDWDAGLIHVQRTLVYYPKETPGSKAPHGEKMGFAINSTKTVTSARDLPLTDEVRGYLQQQREQAVPCNVTIDGVTDFVFVNKFGQAQHQGTLNKALRRIVKDANADPDAVPLPSFSCHTLRHTFCTNMIRAGVELTAVSAMMGHRDIATTANIYNDVQAEQMAEAAQQAEEYTAAAGTKVRKKC